MTTLTVRGLVKGFGARPVLAGVDLDVAAGSLTAILGPSGSGKTTLLRVVAGFERAESGSVRLDDTAVDDGVVWVPPERRGIGYVPQEGNLFPHLSVAGNIAFGLPRGAASRDRVGDLLDTVGMAGLARRYPHQLSGGQQQRVALARALAVRPGLVLLDEPFSSLDAALRASVRADVLRVLTETATTAVLVTHDQDEALSMADAVAVIRDGVIAQRDPPERLYAEPADPELARFVGDVNLLTGSAAAGTAATALGPLTLREPVAAGPVTVLVRPEQLELGPPAPGLLRGTVLGEQYYGHDAIVRVRLDAAPEPVLVVRTTGARRWRTGESVAVRAVGPVSAWEGVGR